MKTQLVMVDDFAPQPVELRELALGTKYESVNFEGEVYHGIGYDAEAIPFDLPKRIAQAVGFGVEVKYSYFRLTEKGVDPTVWIHPDTMCSEYAGVLYLNLPEQCFGGTAFWTHNALGWDELPADIDEKMAKVLNEDGNAQERWRVWTMNTLVGMKFNRFIAYPSKCFHSRYPREAWGEEKKDARLVWVAFFNRKA